MKKLLMCILGVGFFLGSVSDMYGKEGKCSDQKTESECKGTMETVPVLDVKTGNPVWKEKKSCIWENNVCKIKDLRGIPQGNTDTKPR